MAIGASLKHITPNPATIRPSGVCRFPHILTGLLLLAVLTGCGHSSTGPDTSDRIVAGVNLSELFAPPTPSELDRVWSEWSGRDVTALGAGIDAVRSRSIGGIDITIHTVAHSVGGNRHYGAVIVPAGADSSSLPVLVYSHGGDAGVNVDATLFGLSLFAPDLVGLLDEFVFAIPSFRSEKLVVNGETLVSEGDPSPWDRDVDDALALINATLDLFPEADSTRIGVLGFSRGAGVGMLMAVRDPRIDAVVEFFGPTDFFGAFVQDVTAEALAGTPRDLPGLDYLDAEFIQPLKRGERTPAEVRYAMAIRSPVYFAEHLPRLQIHHGTADEIVPVGEAERLIAVMQELGRNKPGFEYYLYENGAHSPFESSLPGAISRTVTFLKQLEQQEPAGI